MLKNNIWTIICIRNDVLCYLSIMDMAIHGTKQKKELFEPNTWFWFSSNKLIAIIN